MHQHHETTAYNWRDFLAQWSKDVLTTEIRASGWLGYPGATEAEIAPVEISAYERETWHLTAQGSVRKGMPALLTAERQETAS